MRTAADGAGERALRCLVAARAEINAREAAQGRTALFLAACFRHAEAAEALARPGGDVDVVSQGS
jgi:ankyrin repeat protein